MQRWQKQLKTLDYLSVSIFGMLSELIWVTELNKDKNLVLWHNTNQPFQERL